MSFKLYDYQEPKKDKIIKKLSKYGIAYLIAEPRFGKTHTTMQALDELGCKHVLYVTVKAALCDIEEDYEVGGYNFSIKVINYEQITKMTPEYDAIVFDESSKIAAFSLKPNAIIKACYAFRQICNPDYVVLSNATPSVESYNQYFHPLKVAGYWKKFKTAKAWFAKYGVPTMMRVAGGRQVPSYKKVKNNKILKDIKHLLVKGTRKEANFTQTETKIEYVPVQLKNTELYDIMKRDNYLSIGNHEFTADSSVKVMSKLQQITGGFMYDDEGRAVNLSTEKLDWCVNNVEGKTAIYCKYRHEVEMLKAAIPHQSYRQFKEAKFGVFISQIRSGSKGLDLHTATQHIFYSLDFSGEVFIQALDRQHNKKRKEPVVVKILTTGEIDQDIAETVTQKKDFNTKLYRSLK